MKRKILFASFVLLTAAAFAQMMGPGGGPWGGPGGGPNGPAWNYLPPGVKPLTLDNATQAVRDYLKNFWGPDLGPTEVMEFQYNFYAEVAEKSTGTHAFELLVNKYTGAIAPEPGPNMMWNTKYGHMGGGMMNGGMMGAPGWGWGGRRGYRGWSEVNKEMSVTPAQAHQYAQEFLDARLAGTKVEDDADTFYGYYTIHVLKDGKTYGMLGVNGYTGWVWYHDWHGDYVGMTKLD